MVIDSYPEDVDWAPPVDVVRLIARQAARAIIPGPSVSSPAATQRSLDIDEEQPRMDANLHLTSSSSRELNPKAYSQKALEASGASAALGRSWKSEKSDAHMNTSLSQSTVLSNTLERDDMTLSASASGGVRSRSSSLPAGNRIKYSIRPVHQRFVEDQCWKKYHHVPWDGSLRVPRDLYSPATQDVCACQAPFDDLDYFCKRCGCRRPVEPPHPIPMDVPKVISVINQEQNIIDRQYAWSGLYAQRLYKMQVEKFEEEETYQVEEFFTPRTNPNSIRIAAAKDLPPLMERVNEILKTKERKLEQQRQEKEEATVQDMQKGPVIHPKSVQMSRNLNTLYRWDMRRTRTIQNKLDKQRSIESDECPFKPAISAASSRITQDYVDNNVHDRLNKDAQRRRRESNEEYQHSLNSSPFKTEISCPRSKSATPSTTAPNSPRSGSQSSIRGRSLSPGPQRGQKTDSWRGRAAFYKPPKKPQCHLEEIPKAEAPMPLPRASACVIRAPSVDAAELQRMRKVRAVMNRTSSLKDSPSRRSTKSSTPRASSKMCSTPRGTGGSLSARSSDEKDNRPAYFTGGANRVKYNHDFHVALSLAHGSHESQRAQPDAAWMRPSCRQE